MITDSYTKLESDLLSVAKVEGKDLSANDFTNEYKAKLVSVEQTDWWSNNKQLNVLTRALESVGDISSQPLEVDFTYQYGAVDVANICISRKCLITTK